MTPRGSLPLKVRVPGCAPIRRASGTHDKVMRRKLIRMVHALHEQGRDDIVNAIAGGRLKPLEVFNRWKYQRLADLPHADELPRFRDTWRTWLENLEHNGEPVSDEHRHNTELYFLRFEKRLPESAPIGAIVDVLKEYRVEMRQHARTFNLAQSNVMAFLRDTLGRRHRYWLDAADIPRLKVKPSRAKHPLTGDQLRDRVRQLGEPWGPMAWTMATTGMGWKEYTGQWEREAVGHAVGLRIHGTKTEGRNRLVPLVSLLHEPEGTIGQYRPALAKVGITPYDLRRTYAGIMVDANVPRPRRKLYLGHSVEDITGLYEQQEVAEYLQRDAEAMRRVLGEPEGGPKLQVVRA